MKPKPPQPAPVLELVREALGIFLRDTERALPGADGVTPATIVFGTGGVLDSLGLIGFVADVETRVAAKWRVEIVLADERAMSRARSPFRTVASFAELVAERITEAEVDERGERDIVGSGARPGPPAPATGDDR